MLLACCCCMRIYLAICRLVACKRLFFTCTFEFFLYSVVVIVYLICCCLCKFSAKFFIFVFIFFFVFKFALKFLFSEKKRKFFSFLFFLYLARNRKWNCDDDSQTASKEHKNQQIVNVIKRIKKWVQKKTHHQQQHHHRRVNIVRREFVAKEIWKKMLLNNFNTKLKETFFLIVTFQLGLCDF